MITAEQFKAATGRDPEQDDLERCNCSEAGAIGHLMCGWNRDNNLPQFDVGELVWNGKLPRSPL